VFPEKLDTFQKLINLMGNYINLEFLEYWDGELRDSAIYI